MITLGTPTCFLCDVIMLLLIEDKALCHTCIWRGIYNDSSLTISQHRIQSHWNYRKYIWEWDLIANMTLDSVISRQLAEMPRWVTDHHPDRALPRISEFELDTDDSRGVWTLVREGLYDVAVERVWDVFGRQSVLVLESGMMERDPRGTMHAIETFLGIQHHDYGQMLDWRSNINPRSD